MPIVQTWLSDEDYIKYLDIKKSVPKAWTEFIHNALNGVTVVGAEFEARTEHNELILKPIKTPKTAGNAFKYKPAVIDERFVIKTPKDPLAKLHKDIMTDGFKDRPIIRSPKDAEKAVELKNPKGKMYINTLGEVTKFCKIHGTPLTANEKCLIKGCKNG